jgi:hypothetical protein
VAWIAYEEEEKREREKGKRGTERRKKPHVGSS